MADARKETCTKCSGAGSLPHEKRKLENGEADPADFKLWDLCDRCGGAGVVTIGQGEKP